MHEASLGGKVREVKDCAAEDPQTKRELGNPSSLFFRLSLNQDQEFGRSPELVRIGDPQRPVYLSILIRLDLEVLDILPRNQLVLLVGIRQRNLGSLLPGQCRKVIRIQRTSRYQALACAPAYAEHARAANFRHNALRNQLL